MVLFSEISDGVGAPPKPRVAACSELHLEYGGPAIDRSRPGLFANDGEARNQLDGGFLFREMFARTSPTNHCFCFTGASVLSESKGKLAPMHEPAAREGCLGRR